MAFRTKATTAKEIDILLKKRVAPYYPNGAVESSTIASLLKIDPIKYKSMLEQNQIPYKEILDYCIEINANALDFFYKKSSWTNGLLNK